MSCDRPLLALDDEELVRLYLEGDEAAIAVLYLRYWRRLYDYGAMRLASRADAHDLVQSVWEAVLTWRGLGRQNAAWRFRAHAFLVAKRIVGSWQKYRWVRSRARDELVRLGGRPLPVFTACAYCEEPAIVNGLCFAHDKRKKRGATEEEMKQPIARRKSPT